MRLFTNMSLNKNYCYRSHRFHALTPTSLHEAAPNTSMDLSLDQSRFLSAMWKHHNGIPLIWFISSIIVIFTIVSLDSNGTIFSPELQLWRCHSPSRPGTENLPQVMLRQWSNDLPNDKLEGKRLLYQVNKHCNIRLSPDATRPLFISGTQTNT